MSVPWRTAVLCFLALSQAGAQQSGPASPVQDTTNAMCVENMQIPSYPPLARMARIEGTLSVTIKLGRDSAANEVSAQSRMSTDNGKEILVSAIETALRKSQFRRDCAGKVVVLQFEFRFEGDPYDRQTQEISFGYPNRFRITTRPPIPVPEP